MCRKVQDSRNQCDMGSLRRQLLNSAGTTRCTRCYQILYSRELGSGAIDYPQRRYNYNALRNDAFRVAMVASGHRPSCARSLRLPRSLSGFGGREGHRGQERILLRRSVHPLSIPAASRRSLLGAHRRYPLHPVCYGRYTKG